MLKNKKHPRYKSPSDWDFHGQDRARTKQLMVSENYDALPIRESMRKAVFRGDNAHGDNTSFGYNGGGINWGYFDKLLRSYIGKEFAVYYQAMTIRFPKGRDRDDLNWFIKQRFNRNYRFCTPMWDYSIVDGKIVNDG